MKVFGERFLLAKYGGKKLVQLLQALPDVATVSICTLYKGVPPQEALVV